MPERAFRTWLLALAVAGLFVRTAHLGVVASGTLPRWHLVERSSDAAGAWALVQQLRGGDWLGAPAYRPASIPGTPEQWERWVGPAATAYTAPLYPYLLALALPADGDATRVFTLQVLLDTCTLVLVGLLGRRWGSPRAGLIAAGLYAVAQPVVALSSLMLRDCVGLFLLALGLWCFERAREAPSTPRWLAAGAVVMLGVLQRENLLPVVAIAAALAWKAHGPRATGLVLAGALAVFSPWLARNVATGAPPLSLSAAGPVTLVAGLSAEPDANPIGYQMPARVFADLDEAHGSMVRMLGVLWTEADGHRVRFLRVLGLKLWGLTSAYEPADNVDLDNLTHASWPLALCLPTGLFLAAVLLGCAAAWKGRDRAGLGFWVFWALAAVLLLPPVFWRLRAGLLPVALPLGVSGLELLWKTATRQLAFAATGLAALATLLAFLAPPKALFKLRWIDALVSAKVHVVEGDRDAARAELEDFVALGQAGRVQGNQVRPAVQVLEALRGGEPVVFPDF